MPELTTSITDEMLASSLATPDELPTPDVSDLTSAINNITVDETDRNQSSVQTDVQQQSKRVKGVRFEGIQDTLPRSRSYSGRSDRSRRRNSKRKSSSEHHISANKDDAGTSKASGGSRHHRRHASSQSHSHSHGTHGNGHGHGRHGAADDDNENESDDASSVCSTCSSSSSSTDDHVYQLPQRRHYGGVRVSYVPNDALACARQRKQQTETEKDNKNCIIS